MWWTLTIGRRSEGPCVLKAWKLKERSSISGFTRDSSTLDCCAGVLYIREQRIPMVSNRYNWESKVEFWMASVKRSVSGSSSSGISAVIMSKSRILSMIVVQISTGISLRRSLMNRWKR